MATVLLLDNDLFFVVKVTDTLKHAGHTTVAVRALEDFSRRLDPGDIAAKPDLALVNTAARGLDFRAAIARARAAGVPVIAFGSHVDLATQEEARRAGATQVIANSRLASDLPGIVDRALRRETTGEPEAAAPP